MESLEARIKRLELATRCVIEHPDGDSFAQLIDGNRENFFGFRLVYASTIVQTDFKGATLQSLTAGCPALTCFFGGRGLFFFDDELYDATRNHQRVGFPLDYSVSFDTQVAESFRCYEAGKQVSKWDEFELLLSVLVEREFNFDYTFYMLEDLKRFYDFGNRRPFDTVRALKRFDHICAETFKAEPRHPKFNESREDAGRRAADAIASFMESPDIARFQVRRKVVFLALLKATSLVWRGDDDMLTMLRKTVDYCCGVIGKFPKLEIYFAWKLIKFSKKYDFFHPVRQARAESIGALNGMSWDLFCLRHQETMASGSRVGRFYVPFIATFDRKFRDLVTAYPIRCLLMDSRDRRINTIFFDEEEFFTDFGLSGSVAAIEKIGGQAGRVRRLQAKVDEEKLDAAIVELQTECLGLCGSSAR